jgi:hypothetical protein
MKSMGKGWVWFALVCLVASLWADCAAAAEERETFASGDYTYVLDADTAIITDYDDKGGELVIPDRLDGHMVTGMAITRLVTARA